MAQLLIGNVKGPQGDTGATGATGPQGDAATINVGSVSTTAYGNPAQVVNVGTESEAVLNFVIPQGKPGQATTTMGGLTLDTITTSTASFPSPQVGDTGATAFGKIVKWFADGLAAITGKLDAANVVNNLTTTEAGYALDARQGKALNDSLTIRSLPVSEVFVPSSGWTLNNTSNVFYNKAGLVEIELVFTASPIAQTGGRYMIGTFTKCAPYHALTVQCPIATVDNAYLTNSVPAIVGNNINIDNFTGGNVANVRVHAIYFSTYVPS